jgi:hypothetical protein
MKLENYSKLSKLIWNSWREGKITTEEKSDMLAHILEPGFLKQQIAKLIVIVIFLGISVVILLMML